MYKKIILIYKKSICSYIHYKKKLDSLKSSFKSFGCTLLRRKLVNYIMMDYMEILIDFFVLSLSLLYLLWIYL